MNALLSPGNIRTIIYILFAVVAIVILNWILRAFVRLPKRLDNRRGRTYVSVIRNMISFVVFLIGLHVIFGLLNINLAPLLASAGIIGLSIGLGAKPLIEDLIAGLMFLSQDSIAIGDYVKVEESVGRVENIGLRTLKIRADDDSLHMIPNGMIKKVINYSRNPNLSKIKKTSDNNKN
ncbi:MAG TPA: mechanosensitive ion channel domain-containing protein [Candidatus Saccharimonadales bacterium]|nr:mechanosensitive ion channel domain-containing protein [Candidatus Saccharimonadales bacterium]